MGRRTRRAGHDVGYSPMHTGRGYELASPNETGANIGFTLLFAVIWTAAIVGMTVVALVVQETLLWVFVAVFWLSEFLVIAMVGKVVAVRRAWSASRLIIDTWPLELGSTASAWFARPLAKTSETPLPASARLILRESATYRVGTDTRTATEDVWSTDLALNPETIEGVAGYRFGFTVDKGAPPTIQLDANLLEWILEFDLSGHDAPETCSLFTILVAPRVRAGS